MTTPTRSLPSLSAVLASCALVLLGCSSSPAAAPSTAPPSGAAASSAPAASSIPAAPSDSTEPSADPAPASDPVSSDPVPVTTPAGSEDPTSSGTDAPGDTAGGSTAGPARIEVSGAICDLLEKKIPVAEMATLSGLAVDRTIEMGDGWCIYTSGGPDEIVTVQYQKDAKSTFDLLGADGTPVDTTTLGVPMYSDQDLNGVYFLDGTTQWEVRVGNAGNGADPAKYAAAITVAQKLLAA